MGGAGDDAPLCYVLVCLVTYNKVGILSSLYQSKMSNYSTRQSIFQTFFNVLLFFCTDLFIVCLTMCLRHVGGILRLNYNMLSIWSGYIAGFHLSWGVLELYCDR